MANEESAILRYLIENKEKKFSINQIAKARKINYKSAYQNVQKLEKRGVIMVEKLGNITLCSFNYKFDHLVFIVEEERVKEVRRNKVINSVCRNLSQIENPFFIALLFGSYASGKQTKHSDIDLLILVNDKKLCEKIKLQIKILPFDIHLIDLSTVDFLRMMNSRKFTVVEEVKKNNIILKGIEDYYSLIKDVR